MENSELADYTAYAGTIVRGALTFLLAGGLVSSADAAELKIIDELGLVRAIAQTEEPRDVMITFTSLRTGEAPIMKQIDGLKPDIPGLPYSRGYQFPKVSPGTWRILFEPVDASSMSTSQEGTPFTSARARDYKLEFTHD